MSLDVYLEETPKQKPLRYAYGLLSWFNVLKIEETSKLHNPVEVPAQNTLVHEKPLYRRLMVDD